MCCSCKYPHEFFESFNLISIKAHKLKLSDDSDETLQMSHDFLTWGEESKFTFGISLIWILMYIVFSDNKFLFTHYVLLQQFTLVQYYEFQPCDIFWLCERKISFQCYDTNHIHCHWPHCIFITVHNQNLSWQYCKISLILFSRLSFYIYLLIIHNKKKFWNTGLQNFFFFLVIHTFSQCTEKNVYV